jgi:hypothetical protein
MNRSLLLAAALAAACGDVKDRADCSTSAACAAGEYCAHTREGSVCWPDPVPPAVGGVTVTCASPCLRDGLLEVSAVASDDKELLAVEAIADLAPDRPFPLARVDGGWSGQVDLGSLPFPAMEREVAVTVRARDGAGNVAEVAATERPVVTRVRWEKALDTGLVIPTPPAVSGAGVVVVGGSDGKLRFFGSDGEPVRAPLTVAGGAIDQPASIGAQAIWVGANDGKLYAVALDGSAVNTGRTCTASGTAKGPPAILTTGGVDVAFGAFSNGRIYASGPTCVPTAETPGKDPYTSGVALDGSGGVYGATATLALKAVRRHIWDGEAFAPSWEVDVGDTISAALAMNGTGSVLTGSAAGEVERTWAGAGAGTVAGLATLDGSIDESPIVLSNGDVVVGDASGKLHRLSATGARVWDPPVDLGAAVHAPMALLTADGQSRWFLVATADGVVHALGDDGAPLWKGAVSGQPLGAGNLHTPAGSAFSTAYFAGDDGKLYALAVEGRLDTSSPWPKAWHDARNTSRAGGPF